MYYAALFLAIICSSLPFYILALSPLIVFYPLFLFLALQNRSTSFLAIAIWALVSATLEHLPVADALISMAPENSRLAFIPSALLILYTASYSAAWFFYTQKHISGRPLNYQIAAWTLSLFCYLIFKDQAQFFLFGDCLGYLFCNPLLALSYYPWLVTPLCAIPQWVALLWFAALTSIIIWLYSKPDRWPAIALIVLIAPWILITRPPAGRPEWLGAIGHLPIIIPATASLGGSCALLAHELQLLKQQFPFLTTVILPESAWNSTNLSNVTTITLLEKSPIPDLLIGSFLLNKQSCYNTIYHYHQGAFICQSSKRYTLPLAERPIPLPLLKNLYFENSPPLCSSQESKPLIKLHNKAVKAVIYICSELFFNTTPDDPYTCLIIAVANDWWFRMAHFSRLMANAARLRAMQWKRPIIYVSYHYAHYFDITGNSYPLITCSQSRYHDF